MQKSEFKILIVEDDPTLGAALEAAFKRSGYSPTLCKTATAAQSAVRLQDFHGMVMDCMLPKIDGVELAAEFNKRPGDKILTVLTSGVYKDKAYAKDATRKASAEHFLVKPFELTDLVNIFDENYHAKIENQEKPIHELFNSEEYSATDRINSINATSRIHGFDLPWIYSLLSAPKISGKLLIEYENDPIEVFISQGNIAGIKLNDTESYFGVLLIENGFVDNVSLAEGLNDTIKKPIGEKLVDASNLSPHAIEVVQKEQMIIRLSKSIRDAGAVVKFTGNDNTTRGPIVEPYLLSKLTADWIASKINLDWLKAFYASRLSSALVKGANYSSAPLLLENRIAKSVGKWLLSDNWPESLNAQLAKSTIDHESFFKAIHFLLINRAVRFADSTKAEFTNVTSHRKRLEGLWKEMEKELDHFKILGLASNARGKEVQRVYQSMAKALHPDKLPPSTPADVMELANLVFGRITEAYRVLNNDELRANFLSTMQRGAVEEALESETIFDQSFQLLQSSRFRNARKGFEKVMRMKGRRSDCMIYLIWALILEKRNDVDKLELYNHCQSLISQVAHEDRHSGPYFFIKGLCLRLSGQNDKAFAAFKHVLTLDPDFIEAKRELSSMRGGRSNTKSIFTDDLSSVVGRMFNTKKIN